MSPDHGVRKLVAILAADVVGYSRLVECDETGTLVALRAFRVTVFDRLVPEHRGRIVKVIGDGFVVELGSAVDAVTCAVAIQRETPLHQADGDPERRIVLRIGINLGDVVVDGDDLLGDGVNVAARLEQLCPPGGVVISGTTYDQLQGRFAGPLDFVGEHKVKNISRPVRVYQVRLDGRGPPIRLRLRRLRHRALAGVLATLAAGGVASGLWWRTHPGKALGPPAVAVLPFENRGPDEDARLVDGLTEDVVTDLARNGGLIVMSRGATQSYKGRPFDLASIQNDLSVRYVLEGSVQRQNDRVKVTAQLLDAGTGAHLWSERFDRPAGEVFAVQGEIGDKVANWIYGTIGSTERAAAKRKRPTDLNAYERYLVGIDSLGSDSPDAAEKARDHFLRAISLDPSMSRAYAGLATSYLLLMMTASTPNDLVAKAEVAARRAVELDPLDAVAHNALGNVLCGKGSYDLCKVEFDRALQLSPNAFDVIASYAGWADALGAGVEGAVAADRATRVYPAYPTWAASQFAFAYLMVGRFADAIRSEQHVPAAARRPFDYVLYATSLAKSGRLDEARKIAAEGVAAFPALLTVEAQINRGNDWAPHELPLVEDGMRKAGFPLCAAAESPLGAPTTPPLKRLPECLDTAHR